MAHGSELADLFFRADKVLSEADQARTNELRRNYRLWRKGGEGVEPHADPVALKHTATIDESRSQAKMRRVKTYGNRLGAAAATPAFSPTSSPTQEHATDRANGSQGRANGSGAAANVPLVRPDSTPSAIDSVTVQHAITPFPPLNPAAPMLARGGCPFPQGEMPPPVALPTATGDVHAVATVPGGCPFRQASTVTPPPTDLARSRGASSGLVALAPSTLLSGDSPVAAPGVPTLTAAQLAAFQKAYIKALQEQKELLAQSSRQAAANATSAAAATAPMVAQASRPGAAPARSGGRANGQTACPGPNRSHAPVPQLAAACVDGLVGNGAARKAPSRSGAASSAVSASSGAPSGILHSAADDDDESSEGLVLATSCAHGPLVTHPQMSSSSGMLVSVFPSSNESWLYVLMAGEFGVPFNIGLSAKGVVYGRLQFRAKMQQWALLHVDPSEWKALSLDTLIPATVHAWKSPIPPKSDARWICFPYLSKEPESCLDLPHLLAHGSYCLDVKPDVSPIMLSAQMPIPEATVQRDVKAIGARPTKKEAPKSSRKRQQKTQGSTPMIPDAALKRGGIDAGVAPAEAPASSASFGSGRGNPSKRARGAAAAPAKQSQPFDPRLTARRGADVGREQTSVMGAFSPGTSGDMVMRQLLQSLVFTHNSHQQHATQQIGQQQAAGSNGATIPSPRSMFEFLQYLEGAAKCNVGHQSGVNGQPSLVSTPSSDAVQAPSGGLPDSASFASLLGLLRSDSMQQSLAMLESQRADGMASSSELNLAALVRAASSNDMANANGASHDGMPPPQIPPWGGRGASRGNASLPGPPSIEDFHELQALAGSLKESPSVSSLMDLVRSSSASSLMELMNYSYSATNLAGME